MSVDREDGGCPIVINDRDQYRIWPTFRDVPVGWGPSVSGVPASSASTTSPHTGRTDDRRGDARPWRKSAVHASDEARLAPAQRALWRFSQLDPASVAYNLCFHLALEGDLDHEALAYAANDLLERHPML